MRLSLKSIDFEGKIKLISLLDGDVKNSISIEDPRLGSGILDRAFLINDKGIDKDILKMQIKTKNSGLRLLCTSKNILKGSNDCISYDYKEEYKIGICYEFNIKKSQQILFNKYIVYITSRDCCEHDMDDISSKILNEALNKGFEEIKTEQIGYMKDFWYKSDVEIKGNLYLQQGIRFNMFHLLQSTGKDGKTNIGAKGLTGEGYEGHYFWDTEMYVIPFFTYTKPEIARKLLEYRYNTLDKARERARQMSHEKGALFPWRTINGEECSAYFPASTAQYHINSDIAYAIKKYVEAAEDFDFLREMGAKIVFESVRIFADICHFVENKGYCIDGVTGPDEYTAIVNNNAYTNIMAKEHLKYAFDTAMLLKEKYISDFNNIKNELCLEDDEIDNWKTISDNMYIPYDNNLKIHPQDDTFLSKKIWDFENTPKEKYPLLLNYHPLVIYRHQVCKQADWVLALFLFSEKFTIEQKKRDFEYYEKITTHDSSLSPCIFSIAACDVGYIDKAYDYFIKTARMDLDDNHGNTKDGIHAANMAGSYMDIVFGFGGFRVFEDKVFFKPALLGSWQGYSFKVNYKKRLIKVSVDMKKVCFDLIEGEDLTVFCYDNELKLSKNNPYIVDIMR
ncbi:glycoside hydrolase family 65 protein [Caloramator quimbayensis]|uniref:glycoside hydrolase family 65 protein n=1 Tax=Caloramator quimbayensis TaxID=1147123 RepID=UPI00241D2B0B|nr:glycosyl hydrolase family 65 protein [Caloramator quimbayensis]